MIKIFHKSKAIIEPKGFWPQIPNKEVNVPTAEEQAIEKMDPVLATRLVVYLTMKREGLTLDEIKYLAGPESFQLGLGYKAEEKHE